MIRHTFRIIEGIGERLERHFWKEGVLSWEDFLATKSLRGLSLLRKSLYDKETSEAIEAIERRDEKFFLKRLKRYDHWRLFDAFKGNVVCLDIETSGLDSHNLEITLIGLFDGQRMRVLMKGVDLTEENLRRELADYKMLITYYGSVFDVPVIKKRFPSLELDLPHFDLCFASHRVGYKGGLKRLEEDLGIIRASDVKGLDGYDAVKLWLAYKRGDSNALEVLMRYNEEDTKNLFFMAEEIYRKLRALSGFDRIAMEVIRRRMPEKG